MKGCQNPFVNAKIYRQVGPVDLLHIVNYANMILLVAILNYIKFVKEI